MTRQRAALLEAIEAQEGFRSAQAIHHDLRERGDAVGLATVYRGLQALADAGVVDSLRTEDGENLYRRCERVEHHHHLVCRSCGRAEEIDGPSVEAWSRNVGASYGFVDIDHVVELFGTCADCRAKG
ncbi:transcriptional repressor [Cellulosimicrobium cellulans]|uniref:Fur family transcriptional regulator n=1 Tax=Cellulosimicrobium cellulans TaxID=1710 RepID=UPI001EDBEA13|nr:Fur family transcriptional regulator [Cellulosimicrobium cellulans]UKJ63329.1 transcriptional repressor [Cellulosimicrobium cellulans]